MGALVSLAQRIGYLSLTTGEYCSNSIKNLWVLPVVI
tara:strand:+ start:264 stop:374 length:111 start_codon:yes stop_codon:yes gene_type:complete